MHIYMLCAFQRGFFSSHALTSLSCFSDTAAFYSPAVAPLRKKAKVLPVATQTPTPGGDLKTYTDYSDSHISLASILVSGWCLRTPLMILTSLTHPISCYKTQV